MDNLVFDKAVILNGKDLTVEELVRVARAGARVETAGSVAPAVQASREALLRKLGRQEIIYGVSTGFGANVKYFIPPAELKALQENVLHSLCCGAGPELEEPRGEPCRDRGLALLFEPGAALADLLERLLAVGPVAEASEVRPRHVDRKHRRRTHGPRRDRGARA